MTNNLPVSTSNPALVVENALLVFTGQVDAQVEDWLQWERDSRDKEILELINTDQGT